MRERQQDRQSDQSGAQHPPAEARHVPDQSRFRLRDVRARRPARHHLGQHRGAGEARRRDGVRGARPGGALAGLGRQDQPAGARASRPTPGPPASPLPCPRSAWSRPRTSPSTTRSSPPSNRRRSTTSPTGASSSTSSPAGCSPRSRCSASRCSATRTATPAPRNGSPSSSGCGPRTTRSTTKAASSRSRRAIWRRSRSSTPTPRS